jgi:hypothetical protein
MLDIFGRISSYRIATVSETVYRIYGKVNLNIIYIRFYYETAWLKIRITAQLEVGCQLSHETAGSGWDLFVVLYLVGFSSFVGCYFIYL